MRKTQRRRRRKALPKARSFRKSGKGTCYCFWTSNAHGERVDLACYPARKVQLRRRNRAAKKLGARRVSRIFKAKGVC